MYYSFIRNTTSDLALTSSIRLNITAKNFATNNNNYIINLALVEGQFAVNVNNLMYPKYPNLSKSR